jgi:hypothetical protein
MISKEFEAQAETSVSLMEKVLHDTRSPKAAARISEDRT